MAVEWGLQTTDPDGRVVVFGIRTLIHLARRRNWLLDQVDVILDTVARPDAHRADPIAGRERFYRQDLDPGRWLAVIVDFNERPAFIVTAFVQGNPPSGWPP